MKKNIFVALLSVFHLFVFAQEKQDLISLSYENSKRVDILYYMEEKFNFSFFYIEEWLGDDVLSGSFESVPLTEVLDHILDKTNLNYYILDDKNVFITQNRVIYGSLPENFFGKKKEVQQIAKEENTIVRKPVFSTNNKFSQETKIETVRIGKEDLFDKREKFILNGYIKDNKTGRGLSNVSLIANGGVVGTVTNDQGYYEIELPRGSNVLETSSLGLKKMQKNVIVYNDGNLDFLLAEDIEELDEVVVEGSQGSNVENSEMSTNEVDSEKSKNIPLVMGERNILKVATTLPGITTAGEGSAGFNVRGGKTDQNLILLDDAVIYNPSHFFGIFQALNPFTTKNIKIYKGIVPAKYGGRLSSVFDITSKDASTNEFKGEASIGPVTNNVALEIPLKKEKTSIMLGGRSSYSDWILKSLDEKSLENSKASFYDLVAKFNTKIDSTNDVRATAYYSKDNFSISSDSIYGYNNRLFSANWNRKIDEKNVANLSLFNSNYSFSIKYNGDSNDDFIFDYGIDEIGLKLNMNYLYDKQHKINYGISTKKYKVNPGNIKPLGQDSDVASIQISKDKGLESAIYLSDEYKINEKILVSLGLRYSMFQSLGKTMPYVYEPGQPRNEDTVIDTLSYGKNKIAKSYGGMETRISGRYMLSNNLSFKIGYNSMFQYIHTLTNSTTISPIDTWKLSDYNIKPQRSQQLAFGLFKNIDGNEYEISLEGYYKKMENVPDFKTGANLLLNENVETEILQGEGKSYGVELFVKKNIGKLNGWIGYTYSRSFLKLDSEFDEERINNGNYFASNYDKPHNLSIVSNYKVTRRFSFSANFEYQTGRPITYPIGNYERQGARYVVYSERNKFRIPDYYRLDLSFNIEGNHKIKKPGHGYWNVSIYNVLGKNNPYSVFFVTNEGKVKAYKSSIFSIPIPSISYNIKF